MIETKPIASCNIDTTKDFPKENGQKESGQKEATNNLISKKVINNVELIQKGHPNKKVNLNVEVNPEGEKVNKAKEEELTRIYGSSVSDIFSNDSVLDPDLTVPFNKILNIEDKISKLKHPKKRDEQSIKEIKQKFISIPSSKTLKIESKTDKLPKTSMNISIAKPNKHQKQP